ncbi:hypothetical protein WR25_00861 [Diploscapter pachys]|uniref:Uncharacterized protein n=1 Tax=Diploscapter pachys TaxID=2018661 RepID=A0A2A2JT78_9BILA|nr:hypothetical protein WR25_00861 [Diploscapter pachys]
MAQIWHSILPLFALFGLGCSAINDRLVADQFCGKFPTLHMCRLRTELEGSLGELQYLLQDATNDVQLAEMSGTTSSPDLAGQPEKRKSTYVRFGKRSASDLLEDAPVQI